MGMKKIQKKVNDWVTKQKMGYWKPLETLARLSEETGEVARELNHQFGPKKKKISESNNNIGDELADVIFTICCLANSLEIDLDKAFKRVMNKYYTRDKYRWK